MKYLSILSICSLCVLISDIKAASPEVLPSLQPNNSPSRVSYLRKNLAPLDLSVIQNAHKPVHSHLAISSSSVGAPYSPRAVPNSPRVTLSSSEVPNSPRMVLSPSEFPLSPGGTLAHSSSTRTVAPQSPSREEDPHNHFTHVPQNVDMRGILRIDTKCLFILGHCVLHPIITISNVLASGFVIAGEAVMDSSPHMAKIFNGIGIGCSVAGVVASLLSSKVDQKIKNNDSHLAEQGAVQNEQQVVIMPVPVTEELATVPTVRSRSNSTDSTASHFTEHLTTVPLPRRSRSNSTDSTASHFPEVEFEDESVEEFEE